MKKTLIMLLALLGVLPLSARQLPQLQVSPDGHYLQTTQGQPFFYLGETAWELFHRLDRTEADTYLADRAQKGYNVIQAVALSEVDGVITPNAYGHLPLVDRDPARPAVKDGQMNDYWDHVDYIVAQTNARGMYAGILPTWGRWWKDKNPIFNPKNAEIYGRWIATRYKDADVIWILGGDRNPDAEHQQKIIRAMARGIRAVDQHSLITFHPTGWTSSSRWFHHDEWLHFNGRQSGHNQRAQSNEQVRDDFHRQPAKPIVELEPLYEDHPLEFKPDDEGHSCAWDVRRALYWSVFNGAAGVTYGHHSVWQMFDADKGRVPINRPLMPWHQAIHQPGSGQSQYVAKLILSRPYFTRVPSPQLIQPSEVHSSVPGAGRYRYAATMDSTGSWAMVYAPIGRSFAVKMDMIKARRVRAWWYCPRTGKATSIGKWNNDGKPRTFTPPTPGEATDWVLVVDDDARKYPAPGKPYKK